VKKTPLKRSGPLKRRTPLAKRSKGSYAKLKLLCDELARVLCMVAAGAAWLPPESGDAFKSRTWVGRCQCCHRVLALQWSHYVSRVCLRLRHDPANTHAICVGCHKRFTHFKPTFRAWMIEQWGTKQVEWLEHISRQEGHTDLRALQVALEAQCREVGAEDHVRMAHDRVGPAVAK
jgi:hypothetical protein